jgi:hypothetical protein
MTKIRYTFDDGSVEYLDRALVDACGHSQLANLLRLKREAQRVASTNGGEATRAAANVEHKDLDDKILACWARGDETRILVRTWMKEHEVSAATVYRRIKALKAK